MGMHVCARQRSRKQSMEQTLVQVLTQKSIYNFKCAFIFVGERRRRKVETLRAKSEERGKEKRCKEKMRPHAHSTDASMELLRGADSSPSISDPFTEENQRVFSDSFKKASWISIIEEAHKALNPGAFNLNQ